MFAGLVQADSSGLVLPSCAAGQLQSCFANALWGKYIFCPYVATEGRTILDVSVSLVKEEKETFWNILGQKCNLNEGKRQQITFDSGDIIGPLILEDPKQILEVWRKIPL